MGSKTAWLVVLVVITLGIFAVHVQEYRVLKEVANSMGFSVPGNALTTSWISGGQTITVTTTREVGESDIALLVRHTDEVKKKLQEKPIGQ